VTYRLLVLFFAITSLLHGAEFAIPEIHFVDDPLVLTRTTDDTLDYPIYLNEKLVTTWQASDSSAAIVFAGSGRQQLKIECVTHSVMVVPGWVSILPPLLAIGLALVFRQVIVSLLAGIWIGAFFVYDYDVITAAFRVIDHYILNSLIDKDHMTILLFSVMLGGMVGIIAKSGGAEGIVQALLKYAKNRKRGQIFTALMGVFIFFDDYANTLIVGNTMRPLTDKLKISREKLAYIVDSTAAPVVSLMFISTWIGYEVSLIQDAFAYMNYDESAYLAWLSSVPYRFYVIIALGMVFMIGWLNRDFGPMAAAERRVVVDGKILPDNATPLTDTSNMLSPPEKPKRWINAVIPVMGVIIAVFATLYILGYDASIKAGQLAGDLSLTQKISVIIGNADSFKALLWGSAIGVLLAALMAMSQRILSLHETVESFLGGVRAMVIAVIILTLAWSIGEVCAQLMTAKFVVGISKDILSVNLLPVLVFVISAAVAFATGTSWGTMAIIIPIVLPLTGELGQELAPEVFSTILFATIASVLSGAVFGDHCSPISDTTIMSSMASGADHIDHVRTQLPYSLSAAAVAMLFGYIPAGFGISPWILIPIGLGMMWLVVRLVGRKVAA
jgi:Na+/H+ antiporter NhaC